MFVRSISVPRMGLSGTCLFYFWSSDSSWRGFCTNLHHVKGPSSTISMWVTLVKPMVLLQHSLQTETSIYAVQYHQNSPKILWRTLYERKTHEKTWKKHMVWQLKTSLPLLLHSLALRGRSPCSQRRPHDSRVQDKWKTNRIKQVMQTLNKCMICQLLLRWPWTSITKLSMMDHQGPPRDALRGQGATARMAMLGLVVTRATAVAADTPGVPANCRMIFSIGNKPNKGKSLPEAEMWEVLTQPTQLTQLTQPTQLTQLTPQKRSKKVALHTLQPKFGASGERTTVNSWPENRPWDAGMSCLTSRASHQATCCHLENSS